jgi:hypothetical protein
MKCSFRGNANLQIMIDGKPSVLTGEELKQYLKHWTALISKL